MTRKQEMHVKNFIWSKKPVLEIQQIKEMIKLAV